MIRWKSAEVRHFKTGLGYLEVGINANISSSFLCVQAWQVFDFSSCGICFGGIYFLAKDPAADKIPDSSKYPWHYLEVVGQHG